jgi:putative Mg2+ transporter-C (MgtC) family protein
MGIGFVGGGIIYLAGDGKKFMHGLTTAASLWVTAGLGIFVALGFYLIAVAVCLLTLMSLTLPSFPFWTRFSKKKKGI